MTSGALVERVARSIDPGVWTAFDDYAEHKHWTAEERAEEIRERGELSCSSLNRSLGRARAAIKATRLEHLQSQVEMLRKALEPFARIRADDGDDFSTYPDDAIIRCEVTAGELRAARAEAGQ